jgi:ribose transport system permease protein
MSVILVTSLGMALVIGTGGIDLSVGAVIALSNAFVAIYMRFGYGTVGPILIALAVGALVGLFNGSLVGLGGIQPIIATLPMFIGARAFAQFWAERQTGTIAITYPESGFMESLGYGKLFGRIPYTVIVALGLTALVAFVMLRTTFGRHVLGVGDNLTASRLAGLPVRRTLVSVYVLSGLLAAVAGILATARLGQGGPSTAGIDYELNAITAVVVGGTALTGGRVRILGTFAGALFIQLLLSTLISEDVPASLTRIIQAIVIIAAVYAQRGRGQ